MRGQGRGPFIISCKTEEELSKKCRRSSALPYASGAILAIGGIAGPVYAVPFMASRPHRGGACGGAVLKTMSIHRPRRRLPFRPAILGRQPEAEASPCPAPDHAARPRVSPSFVSLKRGRREASDNRPPGKGHVVEVRAGHRISNPIRITRALWPTASALNPPGQGKDNPTEASLRCPGKGGSNMGWEAELAQAIRDGDETKAEDIAARALDQGVNPKELLEKGAAAGIREAGRLWQEGACFLPDIILAAEAYKEAAKRTGPLLGKGDVSCKGRVVIGSVEGDAHDIGKNTVVALLRSSSCEVVDLGVDVPLREFVDQAHELEADVLGPGAYMTTTMRGMEEVIRLLAEAGLRDEVKVIVGGAAVTRGYAEQVGADGYADEAAAAVELVDRLLGRSRRACRKRAPFPSQAVSAGIRSRGWSRCFPWKCWRCRRR